jgi:hypothetical protein
MIMQQSVLRKDNLSTLYLSNIDTLEEEDIIALKRLFKCVLKENEHLFFLCRQEQSLTPIEDLSKLRSYIPSFFKENGKYFIIDYIDYSRFSCCGYLRFNDETINFIFNLWEYFVNLDFFIPKENFTWDDMKNERTNLFGFNVHREEFILSECSNTLFTKNEDGDILKIIYGLDDNISYSVLEFLNK